jgi:hypothetical protein
MPTILRIGGLRVVIYSEDHRPAHVHVVGEGEAVYILNCPNGPLELRGNYGFKAQVLSRIEEELQARIKDLCTGWSEIHGAY